MSKKILIPIVVLLLSLTSCTETIVDRYSNRWRIVDIDVPYASWNCYADQYGKPYYEADVYVPEITNYVYTDGFVLCYLVDGYTQTPLPTVRHHQNANGEMWTTTLDYDYEVGYLHVYYTNNDFNYMEGEPSSMRLRLVLQW